MAQLAKKYRERIQEEYWDDGYYWIALKPGFKNGDDPVGVCHGITESTIAQCYKKLRWSMPCDCEDCKQPSPAEIAFQLDSQEAAHEEEQ